MVRVWVQVSVLGIVSMDMVPNLKEVLIHKDIEGVAASSKPKFLCLWHFFARSLIATAFLDRSIKSVADSSKLPTHHNA